MVFCGTDFNYNSYSGEGRGVWYETRDGYTERYKYIL